MVIISNTKGGYSIKPLQLRRDLTITHAQLQGFCLRPALGFKRTSTVAQREVKSAFQFNRSNASDVTMADPPSDQSRQPPNHLLRSPPVRDVTIDASRAGFDTGRPRNRVMEVTEVSNSHAPIPPPPPPPQTSSTHPLTSAGHAMATTPLEGVGDATGVGFDCSDPRKPAEEVAEVSNSHAPIPPPPPPPQAPSTHPLTSARLAMATNEREVVLVDIRMAASRRLLPLALPTRFHKRGMLSQQLLKLLWTQVHLRS